MALQFKVAGTVEEIEQIHRLNYRTFVEEIPQHPPNPERRLIDRFHEENTYAIGLDGERLVAMLAIRGRRPFSLDSKVPNLDSYLPPHKALCEFRLLAVEKNHRHTRVFQGLMQMAAECSDSLYDLAVISGTVRQAKLYRQLGFVPFGPLVGTEEALYQPMYLTLKAYRELRARTRLFT